jgi:hypothetical protein
MDKAQTHHRLKPWRATTRLAVSTGLGIIVYFAIHRFRPDLPGASSPGMWVSSAFCF